MLSLSCAFQHSKKNHSLPTVITDYSYSEKNMKRDEFSLYIEKLHLLLRTCSTHSISVPEVCVPPQLVGLDTQLLPVPVLHPLHVHQVLCLPCLCGTILVNLTKYIILRIQVHISTRKKVKERRSDSLHPAHCCQSNQEHDMQAPAFSRSPPSMSPSMNGFVGPKIPPFQVDVHHWYSPPRLFLD